MKRQTVQALLLAMVATQPLLALADTHFYSRVERHESGGPQWRLGPDRHDGGFGIYHWNGYGWQRMPGAAIEIGGSLLNPWVVNDRGERFVWSGYGWQLQMPYRRYYDRDRDDRREPRHEREEWRDHDHDRDHDRDRDRDYDGHHEHEH